MLKVVLKYTDNLQDGKNVIRTLTENKILILKTCSPIFSINPRITVLFKDYNELQSVLHQLNCNCSYEVVPIKIKNIKEK